MMDVKEFESYIERYLVFFWCKGRHFSIVYHPGQTHYMTRLYLIRINHPGCITERGVLILNSLDYMRSWVT